VLYRPVHCRARRSTSTLRHWLVVGSSPTGSRVGTRRGSLRCDRHPLGFDDHRRIRALGVAVTLHQLLIVSNRGPIEHVTDGDGGTFSRRGAGGLVTILLQALRGQQATWLAIAPTGAHPHRSTASNCDDPVGLGEGLVVNPLFVPPSTYDQYYNHVSNRTLWFLYHHLFSADPDDAFDYTFRRAWHHYRNVNHSVAISCDEASTSAADIVVFDYHLSLVPEVLRRRRPDLRIAHVIACAWPDPQYFAIAPSAWRQEVITGMLGASIVVFLAKRWRDNFLQCCAELGYAIDSGLGTVEASHGRWVRTLSLPVGVDRYAIANSTGSSDFRRQVQSVLASAQGRSIVARIERMEPCKNILSGLAAFEMFLADNPRAAGQVMHYVLAYDSRVHLEEYRTYRQQVVDRVRSINIRFGADGLPVYLETENDYMRGLAVMSLADVIVVNSSRDGMNVVAKECMVASRREGVLILSTGVGASETLADALLVDPSDVSDLAGAIAYSLHMGPDERGRRAQQLRRAAQEPKPSMWLHTIRTALDDAHSGVGPER
jgi:trehalose 6-phosphate synthase